jgi:hypothetical protein
MLLVFLFKLDATVAVKHHKLKPSIATGGQKIFVCRLTGLTFAIAKKKKSISQNRDNVSKKALIEAYDKGFPE